MDLHYLTFMGRNLENRKKLTLVQTMNNDGMKNKNVGNSVNNFTDTAVMKN